MDNANFHNSNPELVGHMRLRLKPIQATGKGRGRRRGKRGKRREERRGEERREERGENRE
jgi:hypothetical protein